MSLLQPFKELRILDISYNGIAGWLGNEESDCLSKLRKLTHLNLAWNNFDNKILRSLGAFPVLKSLDLSFNNIWPLSSKELVYLSNLEVLILQFCGLNGSLPFKDMANFSSLEILDLSGNDFTGSITPYIGALSSLKAISLSFTRLNGTLNTLGENWHKFRIDTTNLLLLLAEFCALNKLEEIYLVGNDFEGMLPPCLNNLTSLSYLDISENRFNGNLSSSPIGSLTSLEYIDLSYNLFEGFSFSLFANHSKLKVIQFLSGNSKLDIETENHSWDPLFQLKVLVLSNCNLNNFPKFLLDQHELEAVDISHSKLNGSFPIWLLENNTGLQLLNLRSNFLTGHFHLPSNHSMNLRRLDVSDNHFAGKLQENIGKRIPKLETLNLSRNYFEGNLPSSIGDISNLVILDLSFNSFYGEAPLELVANCTSLEILRLSNNKFHGEIFSKHFNLPLASLELQNNNFTGTLPVVPLKIQVVLNISNNHMTGTIPLWIVNFSTITWKVVDLSSNSFEGQIPCGLASFRIINLSHNLLSGFLPSCLNLQNVEHLLLEGNKLTGSLPKAIFNSSSLVTLDIRDNRFSGSIPDEIDGLSNLIVLSLSGNHFSGVISKQLCRLKSIRIMDLSNNSFSGTIPYCFHNITFGKLARSDFVYTGASAFGTSTFLLPYKSTTWIIQGSGFLFPEQVEIEIVMKYRSDLYKGLILDMVSVLDLSFNKLTGEIPPTLGQLSSIYAMNLSYNQLTGPIPKSFSNLTQLESLDLSHNNLSGEIPSVLTNLTFLAVFNVNHNNLSGKVPDIKQFSTFEKSSYEGNPFLCGPPLEKSCTNMDESPPSPQIPSKANDGKWYEVNLPVFSLFETPVVFDLSKEMRMHTPGSKHP
nr:probable LRR receptor-like serine/threonine-protein kinase At4g36180 [Quercus suber]